MIDLILTEEGVIIPVRAKPNARRNAIDSVHDGQLKISITATPEKGKANIAIVGLLSKTLGIAKSSFEIIGGETSGKKRILVRGIGLAQVAKTLYSIIASGSNTEPSQKP